MITDRIKALKKFEPIKIQLRIETEAELEDIINFFKQVELDDEELLYDLFQLLNEEMKQLNN